jgi:hypothetical protein
MVNAAMNNDAVTIDLPTRPPLDSVIADTPADTISSPADRTK